MKKIIEGLELEKQYIEVWDNGFVFCRKKGMTDFYGILSMKTGAVLTRRTGFDAKLAKEARKWIKDYKAGKREIIVSKLVYR